MIAKNIILIGFTSSGKSTVGQALAAALGYDFEDLDRVLEQQYTAESGETGTCREIFIRHGREIFTEYEHKALLSLQNRQHLVLSTGGATPLQERNQGVLNNLGYIVYLQASPEVAYQRMAVKGLPAYLRDDPTLANLQRVWRERHPVYERVADVVIDVDQNAVNTIVAEILDELKKIPATQGE